MKFKEVPVSNLNVIRPGEVVKKVQQRLGHPKVVRGDKEVEQFTVDTHTRCWQHYKVRPRSGSANPQETNYKYCIYDKMHDDYGYTQAWVDFLVEQLRDPKEFSRLYKTMSPSVEG